MNTVQNKIVLSMKNYLGLRALIFSTVCFFNQSNNCCLEPDATLLILLLNNSYTITFKVIKV